MEPPKNCQHVDGRRPGDHIEPYFSNPRSVSSLSLIRHTLKTPEQFEKFYKRREIYLDLGEWHYPLRDGSLQVFQDYKSKRRWSYDERDEEDGIVPYKRAAKYSVDGESNTRRIPIRREVQEGCQSSRFEVERG